MDLILALKNLGFTQQEATIYIQLCKNNAMTGYEAAKLSGISRSNAYAALSNLVDKGYANVIEETSIKYSPVPKDELIKNARRDFDETISVIVDKLDFTQMSQEPYITITDSVYILRKMKNMIDAATLRVYLSCNESVLDALKKELTKATERGLKVVVLCPIEPDTTSMTYYFKEASKSIKIIADTKEVLAGTLHQSLYSKNHTFVQLIRETFINEIALIQYEQPKEHLHET